MAILDPSARPALQTMIRERGLRATTRAIGVTHGTIKRALAGDTISLESLERFAALAPRTRTMPDIPAADTPAKRPPKESNTVHAWSIEEIRRARDTLLRGEFALAKRMAVEMRTNGAIDHARTSRLRPTQAFPTRLVAHESARGKALARRAAEHCIVPAGVLAGINATCVDFGFAVGYNDLEPNDDGTAITLRHREWPIEFVRWDEATQGLVAKTDEGEQIPIVHGDGRWTLYATYDTKPWQQDGAVASACLVWAKIAMGDADWASLLRAHGMAKLMGTLPTEIPTFAADGVSLSTQAQAYLQMLADLASGDAAVGINPAGGKTEILTNGSSAFQIFELFLNRGDRAAARIYCGTDAILGTLGGAPGVDIAELFGVISTYIQSDVTRLTNGLDVGVYQPWAILNAGTSAYAPRLEYELPDPDADKRRSERASCYERLTKAIRGLKDAGLVVTQEIVDSLAADYGISPPPRLDRADSTGITP